MTSQNKAARNFDTTSGKQSILPALRLTTIAESFAIRFEEEGGCAMLSKSYADRSEAFDSLRGQYVGFFNTLSDWLETASKVLGHRLDDLSEKSLLNSMNAGLNVDEGALINPVGKGVGND